jgi:hypothetical protein
MKTVTLQFSDEVYDALQCVAARAGRPFEEVAVEYLARHARKPSSRLRGEQLEAVRDRVRRHAGAIRTTDPGFSDNAQIDADLAREYQDNHEPEA